MTIIEPAYAKINWALDVLGRREDGFHELDMLVTTIALHDELHVEPDDALTLSVNGHAVPSGARNLVLKAADALMRHTGCKLGARMRLVKRVPVRAGLGGGSADCAAALRALNRVWQLGLKTHELVRIGQTLGSDVPVLMSVGLARVRGVGEKLLRMKAGYPFPLVILHPGKGLSTPAVFGKWDEDGCAPLGLDIDAAGDALRRGDLDAFVGYAGNALEASAVALMPAIADARQALLDAGAHFAQMTGSGSAVFGVFDDWVAAKSAQARLGSQAILTRTHV